MPSRPDPAAPLALLLVEDNPADVMLLTEAFEDAGLDVEIDLASDGCRAIEMLSAALDAGATLPDVVVLDLNLPKIGGLEVLDWLKAHPELRRIPAIIMSTSHSLSDVRDAYEHHASTYITKPRDPDDLLHVVRAIHAYWLGVAQLPTREPAT